MAEFTEFEEPSESDKELVEWVVSHTERWRNYRNTNFLANWEEYERIFKGEWAAEDKTRDSERSRIVAPATQQAVETRHAEIMEAIFGQGEFFDIEDDIRDVNGTPLDIEAIKRQLSEDFKKDKIKKAVDQIVLMSEIYGTGVGEIVVKREKEYVPATQPIPGVVGQAAIARDGDERDIKVHSEPYDPSIAEEALNWLSAIKESTEAPEPERDENYCKHYCKYYDASGELGCVGLKKKDGKVVEENLIADPDADKAALLYLQLGQQIKELEEKQEGLKDSLAGLLGVTQSGLAINWTTVAGRKTVDTKALELSGIEIPYKEGKESQRLSIKQTGGN